MSAPAPQRVDFVIVGGGLAGAKAAEAFRAESPTGTITLIGREADRPYNRPPLSKDYLRGETKREDVFVHPADWARQHDVELRLGATARRLDAGNRTLTLDDGSSLTFERLLLATGSEPRSLDVPGADLENVLYLRTLGESDKIRETAQGKRRAVMIGGGFIGAEVAASLRQLGLESTLVTRDSVLWERQFGAQMGAAFQKKLESQGVTILNRDEAAAIEGDGRVARVRTKQGQTLPCELVVIGVGVSPDLELAKGTPLAVEDGIVVDQYLETDHPGIYAAGDIARFYSPLYEQRLRVEHWDVAQQHGEIAGKNAARDAAGRRGDRQPFDQPPYFFSDLFDLSMEYLGHNRGFDDLVIRGDPTNFDCTGFYVKGGRLVAAIFVNRNGDVEPSRALISNRLGVDGGMRAKLADPSIDLQSLAGA